MSNSAAMSFARELVSQWAIEMWERANPNTLTY